MTLATLKEKFSCESEPDHELEKLIADLFGNDEPKNDQLDFDRSEICSCGGLFFWIDGFRGEHCFECEPPPARSMVDDAYTLILVDQNIERERWWPHRWISKDG